MIGTSSGQGAWRALVIISTQTSSSHSGRGWRCDHQGGARSSPWFVGIGEVGADDVPAAGWHLLQVRVVVGVLRGGPFPEGGERAPPADRFGEGDDIVTEEYNFQRESLHAPQILPQLITGSLLVAALAGFNLVTTSNYTGPNSHNLVIFASLFLSSMSVLVLSGAIN